VRKTPPATVVQNVYRSFTTFGNRKNARFLIEPGGFSGKRTAATEHFAQDADVD
jgi:hypothetical protein